MRKSLKLRINADSTPAPGLRILRQVSNKRKLIDPVVIACCRPVAIYAINGRAFDNVGFYRNIVMFYKNIRQKALPATFTQAQGGNKALSIVLVNP